MSSKEKAVKEAVELGGRLLKSLFGGGGGKAVTKTAAQEAEDVLRALPAQDVLNIGRNVRVRPNEILARGASKTGVPGAGPLLSREATAQRAAFDILQGNSRGRRTLASITGEFPELPAGTTPAFRDLRTQNLLSKGKSLEPRTVGDIAQGVKGFAAAKPKTSAVVGGTTALGAGLIGLGRLRGPGTGDQLDQAQILDIISKSGVGQSSEDYLRSLAEQRISDLGSSYALPVELQSQLDARQLQYENALIDANRRYLEAIGAGESVPAASMGAYGQQAQAAQAAAEADTGTAVSGLVPVSGALATEPDMIREEGARQQALQNIIANTAAGSDARMRELAALAGAESVANLRSDYENLLLAQKVQDFRDRQAAERAVEDQLFERLGEFGLARVKAGEGLGTANYVDIVNQYVIEYEGLSDTQKAALASVNGINNAADYAATRLRQDYGV